MSDDEVFNKPTMKFFPRNWSRIEDADVIPVPTHASCARCDAQIKADDFGLSLPCIDGLSERWDGYGYSGEIGVVHYHRYCFLQELGIPLGCIPMNE